MNPVDIEKSVTLTLTDQCNLRCIYCYEKERSINKMTFETAKHIIDKEMLMDDGTQIVNFSFFGGEPFLEFELLVKIINYLYSKQWNKKFSCGVSTNGTLIHGEIKDWLYSNKDKISVGLSFDGNKTMQNTNRSSSFDMVDLPFFRNNWNNNSIKMTISQYTLSTLAEGVIFLHNEGFKVNCNLAYGIDWSKSEYQTILSEELHKLINFYLLNPQIEPCRLLSVKIQYLDGDIPTTIHKWCGTGTHMKAYDVLGNVYPCQFFMPLSMGTVKSKESATLEFLEEIPAKYFGDNCASCKLTPICPTCLGSNYCETGDLYKKSPGFCELQKIIFSANAFFKWNQYKLGQLKLTKAEEYRLLNGIQIIQESITS